MVIAIIAVLIAMLLPAVQKAREAANMAKCQNDLKQMALACYNFENTYQRFPNGTGDPVNSQTAHPTGTWAWSILPFVEQQNYFNGDGSYTIPFYYCPSEPRPYAADFYANGCTDYVCIEGLSYYDQLGIITYRNPDYLRWDLFVHVTDITDGTSNTVMLGERPPSAEWDWGHAFLGTGFDASSGAALTGSYVSQTNQQGQQCPPTPRLFGGGPFNVNDDCSFDQLWSNHIGGANFAMGDGSVRFISYSGNAIIMTKLATRAGGEVVEVP